MYPECGWPRRETDVQSSVIHVACPESRCEYDYLNQLEEASVRPNSLYCLKRIQNLPEPTCIWLDAVRINLDRSETNSCRDSRVAPLFDKVVGFRI
jgi:hypothetical protein